MGQGPCAARNTASDLEHAGEPDNALEELLDELVEMVAEQMPLLRTVARVFKALQERHAAEKGILRKLQLLASVVIALVESIAHVPDEASRELVQEALAELAEELEAPEKDQDSRHAHADPVQLSNSLQRLQGKLNMVLSTVQLRQSSCRSGTPRQLPVRPIAVANLSFQDVGSKTLIGRGRFEVYKGILKRNARRPQEVAVKVYEHDSWGQQKLWDVVEANSRLQMDSCHANVLEILGLCFAHPSFPRSVLQVTPLLSPGSLFRVLFAPSETGSEADLARRVLEVPRCTAQVLFGIASAVEYMHSCRPPVVHLALKAENVLLRWSAGPVASEPREHHMLVAQLCDFRADVEFRALARQKVRETGTHLAPERWLHRQDAEQPPADVFAFGLLIYEVSCHHLAFEACTEQEVMKAVCKEPRALPVFDEQSPCYHDSYESLAQRCWAKDPGSRPTMLEVSKEIERVAGDTQHNEALRQQIRGQESLSAVRRELARFVDTSVKPPKEELRAGVALRFISALRQEKLEEVLPDTELLVACLRSLPYHEAVQEQGWKLVRDICAGSDVGLWHAVQAGALEALVAMLRVQRVSAGVQELGCAVMRTLCGGNDASSTVRKERAAEVGGVEILVVTLRAHEQIAALQASGCGALANLCTGGTSRKQRAAEAGALEVLVAALRAHPAHEAVQERALSALRNICVGTDAEGAARARRAADAGALEAIVAGLYAQPWSATVQEKGCAALRNICIITSAGSEAQADRAVTAGVLEAIMSALKGHRCNAVVQEQACAALHNICGGIDTTGVERVQRAADSGALEAAVASLITHSTNAAVLRRAAAVLRCICIQQDASASARMQRAIQAGALEALADARSADDERDPASGFALVAKQPAATVEALMLMLRSHRKDAAVQEHGMRVLRDACASNGTTDAGKRWVLQAVQAGIFEVLVKAMYGHQDRVAVQEPACMTIGSICDIASSGSQWTSMFHRAQEAGVFEALVATLKTGGPLMQEQACLALLCVCRRNTVGGAARQRRAVDAGAVEALAIAIHKCPSNAVLQEQGSALLKELCRTAAEFGGGGGGAVEEDVEDRPTETSAGSRTKESSSNPSAARTTRRAMMHKAAFLRASIDPTEETKVSSSNAGSARGEI